VRKVVLHIGAGKCGSSALQEYLSKSVFHQTTAGETLAYGVLKADGDILTGATVTEQALSSMFQYRTSASFTAAKDDVFNLNLLESLKTIDCDVLVLSFEGWIYEAAEAQLAIGNFGEIDAEVLVYVRPPAQWLNSAWWQWGAWSDKPFKSWLDEVLPQVVWEKYISSWSQLAFVNSMVVRLLPVNIVQDFCDNYAIDYRASEAVTSNVSLPGTVQRFLQKYRELRPSPHVSRIEFSLARHLSAGRSAWVIDAESLSGVIAATREPNRRLTQWLSEDQAESLATNRAWWEEGYYDDLPLESPEATQLSHEETDALLLDAVKAIHEAEVTILALKKKIRESDSWG